MSIFEKVASWIREAVSTIPSFVEGALAIYIIAGLTILLVVIVLFITLGSIGREPKKEKKEPVPPPSKPKPHDDHHASDDHHGDHHPKKKTPIWLALIQLSATIAAILVVVYLAIQLFGNMGFGPTPGLIREARREVAVQSRTVQQPQAVSGEWQRVSITSRDWSSWIEIPSGHTVEFCDPVRDPSCSAVDFSAGRFDIECRDRTTQQPLSWGEACAWSDANRVRARDNESFILLYKLNPE